MDNASVLLCAKYIINNNCTIRQVAKVYGLSKSGVHYDLMHKLPRLDKSLYRKVRVVLDKNFAEKHIRGGIATKNKYSAIKFGREKK